MRTVERVVESLGNRHSITNEMSFQLFVKDQNTFEIYAISVTAMVIEMPYDVIIGFNTMRKHDILKELLME